MSDDLTLVELARLVRDQQAQITSLVVAITMQQGNIGQLIHGQALLTQSIGALLGEEMGQPVTAETASEDSPPAKPAPETLDPDDE